MKTKVRIDNKRRIQLGLEPIQPSITTVEFSLSELSQAEKDWVAKHYSPKTNNVYRTVPSGEPYDSELFVVTEENEILSTIRIYVAKVEKRKTLLKERKPASRKRDDQTL